MEWLRAVSCEAELDVFIREQILGSCRWFLGCDKYRAWKTPDYVADLLEILWCSGGPGVGKTIYRPR